MSSSRHQPPGGPSTTSPPSTVSRRFPELEAEQGRVGVPSRPAPLFQAALGSRRMTVGRARPEDLASIERSISSGAVTDVLRPAMLVAIRGSGLLGAAVHALGWRCGLADVWATSLLEAVGLQAGVVVTSSGKLYAIRDGGDDDLPPALHEHLAYALRVWGFDDVVAA